MISVHFQGKPFNITVIQIQVYPTTNAKEAEVDQFFDFAFTFHFHALEKEMATHASVLAWRIPGTGEPGGLPSMGLLRIGHD